MGEIVQAASNALVHAEADAGHLITDLAQAAKSIIPIAKSIRDTAKSQRSIHSEEFAQQVAEYESGQKASKKSSKAASGTYANL